MREPRTGHLPAVSLLDTGSGEVISSRNLEVCFIRTDTNLYTDTRLNTHVCALIRMCTHMCHVHTTHMQSFFLRMPLRYLRVVFGF